MKASATVVPRSGAPEILRHRWFRTKGHAQHGKPDPYDKVAATELAQRQQPREKGMSTPQDKPVVRVDGTYPVTGLRQEHYRWTHFC
jgi:hypothetical protein